MRLTAAARPVRSSAETTIPLRRGLPVAGSNFDVMPPRHPCIREIRGAVRQDALVGRLHVRVRSEDRSHFSIKVPAHRDLLTRRFSMEVDDDHARLVADGLDLALYHCEG